MKDLEKAIRNISRGWGLKCKKIKGFENCLIIAKDLTSKAMSIRLDSHQLNVSWYESPNAAKEGARPIETFRMRMLIPEQIIRVNGFLHDL